jgi:hypothetical protein
VTNKLASRAGKIASCLLLTVILTGGLAAQQDKFVDRLVQNRYQLNLEAGKLSGAALPVLKGALAGTQFVLIGEDHGVSQIPQFAAALCEMLAPQGFNTLAIEVGPLAASAMHPWIAEADGAKQLVEFEKKYPESIAFYNFREEYDFLSRCARSSSGSKLRLWGLDQELMGPSGLILDRILDTPPGKQAVEETRPCFERMTNPMRRPSRVETRATLS